MRPFNPALHGRPFKLTIPGVWTDSCRRTRKGPILVRLGFGLADATEAIRQAGEGTPESLAAGQADPVLGLLAPGRLFGPEVSAAARMAI